MTDLERRIRDSLDDQARSTPPPHDAGSTLRRTRRRQLVTVGGGALGALALVAASVVGVTALLNAGGSQDDVPTTNPTTTSTVNGVSITHPERWFVIDPDEVGLNSTPAGELPSLPRLVLAVSPVEFDETFACPGLIEPDPPTFLMTVQEQPLALTGEASAPWPVEPRPLGELDGTGCYPSWEFLGNEWTAAGRSFQVRIGLSPEISGGDRQALLAAFASLTFEPQTEPATSVVLATGTAGGEEWELIAERQTDGLVLSIQGESFGAGAGGFDPTRLDVLGHVFGEGEEAELVLYGAVPAKAVQIGARLDPDDEGLVPVIDLPDTIDPGLNVFTITLRNHPSVSLTAYDEDGNAILSGVYAGREDGAVGAPPPWRAEVEPEHGGTYWGVYLAIAPSIDDPEIREWTEQAERLAYTPSVGDLACDQDAAAALDVADDASHVAIYFANRADAAAAYADIVTRYREPLGIARVRTYCLD